jgi:uridine kinase
MEILQKHRDLLQYIKDIIYPWRKLTIGIDGADGVGKSPISRLISWQLGMPTLETDMFLEQEKPKPIFRYDYLSNLIHWRHTLNRPVVVEGIFLLEKMKKIDVKLDVLIYVIDSDFDGSFNLKERLEQYRGHYDPVGKADYIFESDKNDYR